MRRQDSLAWLVFFVIVVDLIGFGIVIPILPFLSPELGGGADDIALILVSYSAAAAVVAPIWGRLSDLVGRRNILAVCLLGSAFSHFLLAGAEVLWTVYLARAIAGLMAGSLPVATALIADNSDPDQRARAMGLIGRAFGFGLVLGPVIGGVLSRSESDFSLPFVVAGGLSIIAALMAQFLLPQDANSKYSLSRNTENKISPEDTVPSLISMLRQSQSALFVCQFILHTCAISATIYLFPLWVADYLSWQAQEVGLFFGLVGIVMIITQGNILGWLTIRFGALKVLRAGALVFSLSLGIASMANSFWAITLLGLSAFSAATMCQPVLNTIASEIVPRAWRGQFFGLTTSAAAAGRIVGPLLASLMLIEGGYTLAWLGNAAVVMVVVIWTATLGARYDLQQDR